MLTVCFIISTKGLLIFILITTHYAAVGLPTCVSLTVLRYTRTTLVFRVHAHLGPGTWYSSCYYSVVSIRETTYTDANFIARRSDD